MKNDFVSIQSVSKSSILEALGIMDYFEREPLKFEVGVPVYLDLYRSLILDSHNCIAEDMKILGIPVKINPEYDWIKLIVKGNGTLYPHINIKPLSSINKQSAITSELDYRETGQNLREIYLKTRTSD